VPDLFELDFGDTSVPSKPASTNSAFGAFGPDENVQKLNEIMTKMNLEKQQEE
jgi:hypothetical protein